MTQAKRRLRRAITLPKIAAALVGVIAFATIGAIVTLLATSLPNPADGELVASAGDEARPIRDASAQPAQTIQPDAPAITAARVVPVAAAAVPTRQATAAVPPTSRLPQRSDASAPLAPATAALDESPVPGVDLPAAAAFVPTARATAAAAAITKFGERDSVTTGGTKPRSETPAQAEAKPEEVQKASVEPAAQQSSGAVATISSPVNLRSSTNGGKVLGVIPRGAEVRLTGACTHWCAVTWDGRSGFVYKSFIRR